MRRRSQGNNPFEMGGRPASGPFGGKPGAGPSAYGRDGPSQAPRSMDTRIKVPTDEGREKPTALSGILCYPALISLFVTILTGFFGTGILASHGLEWVMVFMFGLTFFFFGVMITFAAKELFGLIFLIVGGVVVILSALFGLGGESLRDLLMSSVVPACGLSLFVFAGLGMMVVPELVYRKKLEKYAMVVDAEIVNKKRRVSKYRDSDGHRRTSVSYPLTWQYQVGGQSFTWTNPSARSPERRAIGETHALYVDPENPGDAWDEVLGKSGNRLLMVMGVIFFGIGALALYLFFAL